LIAGHAWKGKKGNKRSSETVDLDIHPVFFKSEKGI